MAHTLRFGPTLHSVSAVLGFSAPLVGGYILQSANNSINAYWIGRHLGATELVIATTTNSLLFMLIAVLFGISQATGILVARATGAHQRAQVHKTIRMSTRLFAGLTLAIVALGCAFAPALLQLFGAGNMDHAHATAYLRTMLVALVPLMALVLSYAILRGQKNSHTPFLFMAAIVALDAALNPLFIFGWGPVPALGLQGSALASLLANAAGFAGMLLWLARSQPLTYQAMGHAWHTHLRRSEVKKLARFGLPMGAQMLVNSISLAVLLILVNGQGLETAAAYSAALQLWNYLQMPTVAIGSACSIVAAQHIGAQRWPSVSHTLHAGIGCSLGLTGLAVALSLVFSLPLLSLFLAPSHTEALALAIHIHHIVVWTFLLQGLDFVYTGMAKSHGAAAVPLAISCLNLLGLRLPLAWLLAHFGPAQSLWFALPISAAVGLFLSWRYYRNQDWQRRAISAKPL